MGLCLSKGAAAATAAAASAGPMEADAAKAWFVTASKLQPDAKQRLLCLPWEGGSSLAFNHWLVPFTEVVAVELPGRMGCASMYCMCLICIGPMGVVLSCVQTHRDVNLLLIHCPKYKHRRMKEPLCTRIEAIVQQLAQVHDRA